MWAAGHSLNETRHFEVLIEAHRRGGVKRVTKQGQAAAMFGYNRYMNLLQLLPVLAFSLVLPLMAAVLLFKRKP
jgi:hypothetical protein